jgi:phenylacetate-CoA ligase
MNGHAEPARRFYETLLATERLPASQLKEYQNTLIGRLVAHAATTEYYGATLRPLLKQTGPIDEETWLRLPTVDRKLLATRSDAIRAREVPRQLGEVRAIQSGGSTGEPIRLALSDIEALARVVATFRMFTAYGFDLALPLLMIRHAQFGSGRTDTLAFRRWGFPWLDESELGPRLHMDIRTPTTEQFAAISERAPVYINTMPSNLLRLGLEALRRDEYPSIPFMISVAEYLAPETRRLVEASFGGTVIDIVSSAEAGVIAIQCPMSGHYHIQSEIVLAEILDANGIPCAAGEVGELVVTPLYNYTVPLIRYRSGDFVVAGPPCPCGRTLPTIERFVGRREHMFVFPDGSRRLPPIDRVRISQLLGHDVWQLLQTSRKAVAFRFAGTELPVHLSDEIIALVRQAVGDDFAIEMRPETDMPMTSSGKRHHAVNLMVAVTTI